MTTDPATHTLKIGTDGPFGGRVTAERVGVSVAIALDIADDDEHVLLRPADWHAFRDAVDDLLGEPTRADTDVYDKLARDELAHMSARRRYEGIDAPAPELPTDAARNIAALTSALKCIDWQCNRDHGSQWLAGQLHEQGIRVQLPDDDADPLAHVVPGDPDPTNDTNIWCGSKNPLGGARVCHREAGHVGQHIAANGSRVVAVWRDDA